MAEEIEHVDYSAGSMRADTCAIIETWIQRIIPNI